MEEFKGKKAKIRVDYYAVDGLKLGDLVEILDQWEEELFQGEPSLGKRTKIRVKSLEPPYVMKDIDGTDVI